MTESFLIKELVEKALAEDLNTGDRTTASIFPHPVPAVGEIIAEEEMVLAGINLFQAVFLTLDPKIFFESLGTPGEVVKKGKRIARIKGDGRVILKGERTALNFLQRLSGIASLTRQYVEQAQGTSAKIIDTRKTTPGFRMLEKEAVRLGGGYNHRFNLGDLILIKDNHIALAGGLGAAINRARLDLPHALKIEVETKTFSEVEEALSIGVDIVMLDNMSIEEIKRAVSLIRKKVPSIVIEVSGGVQLDRVSAIAQCGVDLISVGALTHSARAVDISLDLKRQTTS